ncbi:microcystin-dependent protein [Sporomusaceae bacterium BoRhaA]|uniref:tail fiber protein n=1 Tax=Pelorhabdus rhamnosifermentans TaxID=2772457 RepID=UPI001C05EEC0|nr:tail fiber protein [Pelorhabdus rhamnosifermentans]MBU2702278.1 microcystin-dependent protein [Pelorhabdus rhamnosifermentans]
MCCCNEKIPVGTVNYFARQFPPEGWLLCDGREVLRDVFADLFNMLGTSFGIGDGKSTFNLPDLRGEFIRGLDVGRGVDTGRQLGSVQADDTKSHYHAVLSYPYRANTLLYTIPSEQDTMNVYTGNANGTVVRTGAQCTKELGTTEAGGSETRPQNIALLACIKY